MIYFKVYARDQQLMSDSVGAGSCQIFLRSHLFLLSGLPPPAPSLGSAVKCNEIGVVSIGAFGEHTEGRPPTPAKGLGSTASVHLCRGRFRPRTADGRLRRCVMRTVRPGGGLFRRWGPAGWLSFSRCIKKRERKEKKFQHKLTVSFPRRHSRLMFMPFRKPSTRQKRPQVSQPRDSGVQTLSAL